VNDLVKTGSTDLATGGMMGMEPEQSISSRDIQIPKVIIMQPGSPEVIDGKRVFGEVIETANETVLASANEENSFEFIPFMWSKKWIIRRNVEGIFKFKRIEDITIENEKLNPYELFEEDNEQCKRELAHFYQVMIPGEPLPLTMCFRGGSRSNGEKLLTQMYITNKTRKTTETVEVKGRQVPYLNSAAGTVMKCTPVKRKNKQGNNYCVITVSKSRDVTSEEFLEALNWFWFTCIFFYTVINS
jgi:hypothetical protein